MSPETLRLWQRRDEVDAGVKPGVTTDAAAEIKRLQKENAELRKANEIVKAASVVFETHGAGRGARRAHVEADVHHALRQGGRAAERSCRPAVRSRDGWSHSSTEESCLCRVTVNLACRDPHLSSSVQDPRSGSERPHAPPPAEDRWGAKGRTVGTMWTVLVILLVAWVVLSIVGFAFEGLLWLAIIGIVLFVGTVIFGILRSRARRTKA